MQIRLAAPLQPDSIVDGEGIRTVVWTQGCLHHCKSCQNEQTWDMDGGYLEDVETIKEELRSLVGQDGITLSGGDPLYQIDACLEISRYAKEIGLSVWCYTGYTLEALLKLNHPKLMEFLETIDVLVDGPFILEELSLDLMFKGSRNQRILDMPKTLEQKKPVLVEKYKDPKDTKPFYHKEEHIYV